MRDAIPELSERSRRVLALLVREYIEHGEPVSSLRLAGHGGLGVSSATVRNIMSQLEELGYVCQPHTSAGRVPTDLGYRCYVEQLLQSRRPGRLSPLVEARLRQAGTVADLLSNVSHELCRVSHHVGFAFLPATDASTFQHIDFVPLDGPRVLVVVIATGGQITHKVVELEESLEPAELERAAAYLNAAFSGMPLRDVREAIVARMEEARSLYDALLARALHLARSSFDDLVPQDTLVVQGASSLLDDDGQAGGEDRASLARLRALFRMIEEKHRLVSLLTQYIEGSGLTIIIGEEHATPDLRAFSLVASTYRDGHRTGAVGVIGPRRMRYSRAISAVDTVSRAVSRVLASEPDEFS